MIGFLDKLFGRKKKVEDNSTDNNIGDNVDRGNINDDKEEAKTNNGNVVFGNITPKIVAELTLLGSKYMLTHFDIEFMQDVNSNNKPDSLTYGGLITMTLMDKPDDIVDEWISDSLKKHDGEIRFYKNDIKEVGNSLINIVFKNAQCLQYKKTLNVDEGINYTFLKINPKYIKIGNEEFETNRKN